MARKLSVFPILWSSSGCPENSDEIAEAFWMDLLPKRQMRLMEAHCAVCPKCAAISAQALDFVEALHLSARHESAPLVRSASSSL